jgi:hypothetical protein
VDTTFNDHFKQLYSEWLLAGGQCSDSNQENKESWCKTAEPVDQTSWQQISPEVIIKGFKKCYISDAMDGREDI